MTTSLLEPSAVLSTANSAVPFSNLVGDCEGIRDELRHAVDAVASSGRFIGGRALEDFAAEFAQYCGTDYAVPCSNGTEALRLAMEVVLGRGDGIGEVVTVSHTFAATVEAILAAGYKPVLVDVDAKTFLMDLSAVERACTPRTVAVVPVHLYGQMVDMVRLAKFASDRGVAVIEDASQAHGARFAHVRPGQCSRAAAFSFYPGKNLGAWGDAGAVVTNDPDVARRVGRLADHGRSEKFIHKVVGANARMDAIQAAVLRVKLPHLDRWNAARRKIAEWYDKLLGDCPAVERPRVNENARHVYHQYVVQVDRRDDVRSRLGQRGVETGIHYPIPVHEQPAYAHLALHPHRLANTHRICQRILSLPVYPSLTWEQASCVADALRRAVG